MKLFKNKGSFLIEAMIGLLISSFLIILILLVYQKAEENKRLIIQSSNMMDGSILSFFPIRLDAQAAGWSIPLREELGCDVIGFNSVFGNNINFKLYPIRITSTGNNLDEVTFISGGSFFSLDRLKATNNFPQNGTIINLETNQKMNYDNIYNKSGASYGYANEQAIIFENGKKCTLFDASFKPTATNKLERKNTYLDSNGFRHYRYNKIDGLLNGENYNIGAYVYMMGTNFLVNSYYLRNGKLIYKDILKNKEKVLLNNIIAFVVKYGVDSNGDGSVDTYNNTEEDFYKIKTLSIGAIVKSPIREREKNGECIITKNNLVKLGSDTVDLNFLVGGDWSCYRYRAFEEEVELRNIRWLPKIN